MRLGIIGGSFDPPHPGHLLVARDVRARLGLDRMLFVPAYCPPHKARPAAAYEHRREMTRLALVGQPGLELCPVEESLSVPSYTMNTLLALRQRLPRARLYFLLGADQYRCMAGWHQPLALPGVTRLVVMSRPGVPPPRLFPGHDRRRVAFLPVIAVAISAAAVRQRLAKARSVRYMLPEAVLDYINRHGLYAAPKPDPRPKEK
jgi:nicotinate-nucleotide adenylyltransferase